MTSNEREMAAAQRRGERILALRRGRPIPHPETAISDARPGNEDDAIIAAMVRGSNQTPSPKTNAPVAGEHIFPPARLLAQHQRTPVVEAANEEVEVLALGPVIAFRA